MHPRAHTHTHTQIKQANFLGDNWVMSGSDCGRVFVWNKWSGEVVNLLVADSHVVNCVQPHPEAYGERREPVIGTIVFIVLYLLQ